MVARRMEEAVTVLCAIKDSKHRSFYALWKITRLFGDISTEKSVDSNNRRSHDDARSIKASRSSLFSEIQTNQDISFNLSDLFAQIKVVNWSSKMTSVITILKQLFAN